MPTYNTSSTTLWTSTGTKTTKLALVGMHVVGSTAGSPGHPEMIWSTFEHFGNTPNAAYQYVNKNGVLTPVPQSTTGNWLFSASSSSGPFNAMHMFQSGSNIQALAQPPATTPPPFTISPSDTIRWKAFGAASDISPNPIDGNTANSNTEIISINDNISGMMAAGDVRNNYFMTGATWTIGGGPPRAGQPSPGTPAIRSEPASWPTPRWKPTRTATVRPPPMPGTTLIRTVFLAMLVMRKTLAPRPSILRRSVTSMVSSNRCSDRRTKGDGALAQEG